MRVVSLVIMVVGIGAQLGAQSSHEMWRRDAGGRITFQNVLPSGDFLVSTNAGTTLLSPETGEIKWQRDDVLSCDLRGDRGPLPTCRVDGEREYMTSFGPYLRFETGLPEGTPSNFLNQSCRGDRSCIEAALLRGAAKKGIGMSFKPTHDRGRLLLVDSATGRDAFDSKTAGLDDVEGTCFLARENTLIVWGERDGRPVLAAGVDLTAAKVLWTRELPLKKDVDCLSLDGAGLWLAQGRDDKDKPRVFGIDAQTGMPRWESAGLIEKEWKLPVALVDTNSVAVVHVNGSGPMAIDLQKGSVLWRADPFRGAEPVGDANGRIPRPQPIVRGADAFYLTLKETLAALSPTGTVVWTRAFRDPPVMVAETSLGLLTRTHGEGDSVRLELVRPENGQTRWSASVSGMSGWLLTPDALFHVSNNTVQRLSLETGQTQALGDAPFTSTDPPVDVSLLDGAVVVTSSEHLAAFEQKGGARYQQRVPAPGLSRTEKLLVSALAGARMAADHALARSRAQAAASTAAYANGGSATIYYFYSVYQPNLGARFASTTNADRFAYMFTARTDGPGFRLVRLDKIKGNEAGWIPFTDKRPAYAIDPVTARVFVKTDDAQVAGYSFTP